MFVVSLVHFSVIDFAPVVAAVAIFDVVLFEIVSARQYCGCSNLAANCVARWKTPSVRPATYAGENGDILPL